MEELNVLLQLEGKTISQDKYGKTYLINDNNLAAVLLARDKDYFILIKQYRRAINDFTIQLPGGSVEKDEDIETAVRREFREETGYQCGKIELLGYLPPASWISNVVTHVYYSDEIINLSCQKLEDYEQIQVIKLSVEDTLNMIKDCRIHPWFCILIFARQFYS